MARSSRADDEEPGARHEAERTLAEWEPSKGLNELGQARKTPKIFPKASQSPHRWQARRWGSELFGGHRFEALSEEVRSPKLPKPWVHGIGTRLAPVEVSAPELSLMVSQQGV